MEKPPARGFTLLEIMLVMTIMAVVASFILPNLFRPSDAGLNDAARQMVRLLHLAAEESQLRGASLRCRVYDDHYLFELAGQDGQWQSLGEPPFGLRNMPEGVRVADLNLIGSPGLYGLDDVPDALAEAGTKPAAEAKQVLLGSIVFRSDGMLSIADIRLHAESGDVQLELRPGPAGIRVLEQPS